MKINQNYLSLRESYLFSTIAGKVRQYGLEHPDREIIRLGIGDVTLPLAPVVVEAMARAVSEMGRAETFRGYDDGGVGYDFLREAIAARYAARGADISPDEIIVGDGAKSDAGNLLDIFAPDASVLIPDPVYPAYVDTNIMAGHSIYYIDGNEVNGFLPSPDDIRESAVPDIVYLCSPNNPTGAVYGREQLRAWVEWARARGAVIFFDAAYEGFVQDRELPTSIYEIEGARECAIEICSFSKLAGFTGVRCGYTVTPRELSAGGTSLYALWRRRQTTKFNGVSYITQRGAEAALSPEGLAQCVENIAYYLENADIIARALRGRGIWFTGGKNAPYIWLRCPDGMDSWTYFDRLLREKNIVGTPGEGFGRNGKNYFRLTAFGRRENVLAAAERIAN
jgi:LL-diaminopimelate aminotransferase